MFTYLLDSSPYNASPTLGRERVVGARRLDRMSFQREVAPKFAGWGEEVEDIVEVGFLFICGGVILGFCFCFYYAEFFCFTFFVPGFWSFDLFFSFVLVSFI